MAKLPNLKDHQNYEVVTDRKKVLAASKKISKAFEKLLKDLEITTKPIDTVTEKNAGFTREQKISARDCNNIWDNIVYDASDSSYKPILIKNSKGVQAAATYTVKPSSGEIVIELLTTAPHNISGFENENTSKGFSAKLLAEIVKKEKNDRNQGRIKLDALPAAIPFYKHIGFEENPKDPDDLYYYLNENKSQALVEKYGFQKGGYTGKGDPDEIAGVVHKDELVVSSPLLKKLLKAKEESEKTFKKLEAEVDEKNKFIHDFIHGTDRKKKALNYLASDEFNSLLKDIVLENTVPIVLNTLTGQGTSSLNTSSPITHISPVVDFIIAQIAGNFDVGGKVNAGGVGSAIIESLMFKKKTLVDPVLRGESTPKSLIPALKTFLHLPKYSYDDYKTKDAPTPDTENKTPQFSKGGYTGKGPRNGKAGDVHFGEYVFTRDEVDAIGLRNIIGFKRSALKNGKSVYRKNNFVENFLDDAEESIEGVAFDLMQYAGLVFIGLNKDAAKIISSTLSGLFKIVDTVASFGVDKLLNGISTLVGGGSIIEKLGGAIQIFLGFKAIKYLLNPASLIKDVKSVFNLAKNALEAFQKGGAKGLAYSLGSGIGSAVKTLTKNPIKMVTPFIGAAIDFVLNIITGDSIPRAATKAGFALAGGLAGSYAGFAAGATVGSIIPGVGTAVGGAVGAFIGAIAGGLAGDFVGTGVANVAKFAKGGLVTKETNAIIGEAGPELVIPLNKLNALTDSASTDVIPNLLGGTKAYVSSLGADSANVSTYANTLLGKYTSRYDVTPVPSTNRLTVRRTNLNEAVVAKNSLSKTPNFDFSNIIPKGNPNVSNGNLDENKPTNTSVTPSPENSGGLFTGSAADIPPEGKALLDAIAGSESTGPNAYSQIVGGTFFKGFKDHPGSIDRTLYKKTGYNSDASGRYQFLSTTWEPLKRRLNLKDFSPENQDKAAWQNAIDAYGKGEQGLVESLRKDPNAVARKLSGQWTSLPGGIEENSATKGFKSRFDNSVSKYKKQSSNLKPTALSNAASSNAIGKTSISNRIGNDAPVSAPMTPSIGSTIQNNSEQNIIINNMQTSKYNFGYSKVLTKI